MAAWCCSVSILVNPTTNTAYGYQSLTNATGSNSTTAFGFNTLKTSTTGNNNTAIGYNALYSDVSGSNNLVDYSYTLGSTVIDISRDTTLTVSS